jgi:UDPglucose 6-dehydrogenase
MKITIIGLGYVGLVTGAGLAEIGNQVVCLDHDPQKVEFLKSGSMPFYESGLKEMVEANTASGHLRFTTSNDFAIEHGDIIFIAVDTPAGEDGQANLKNVFSSARGIGQRMTGFKLVVNKSTSPVGTAEKIHTIIEQELIKRKLSEHAFATGNNSKSTFTVASNPEFLKEGAAVSDFRRPDRIVIGTSDDPYGRQAVSILRQLYAPFNRNRERTLFMSLRSAEFTKYAANAMLASRISLMNELANLSDQLEVDIESVRKGVGADPRIGFDFLYAGTGFGGSCFKKDLQALTYEGRVNCQEVRILQAVLACNESQKTVLLKKIQDHFDSVLSDKTFAIWGLAFKPGTDDMREAPSRSLIRALLERGARVNVHDPVAIPKAREALTEDLNDLENWEEKVSFVQSPLDALRNADSLIIVTEWKEYQNPDFALIKKSLRHPIIFDGRNMYEPSLVNTHGLMYLGVGRKGVLNDR